MTTASGEVPVTLGMVARWLVAILVLVWGSVAASGVLLWRIENSADERRRAVDVRECVRDRARDRIVADGLSALASARSDDADFYARNGRGDLSERSARAARKIEAAADATDAMASRTCT